MTWVWVAIGVLGVISIFNFFIGISNMEEIPSEHKNKHEAETDMLFKHDVRISVLEKYIKKIRKAVDNG